MNPAWIAADSTPRGARCAGTAPPRFLNSYKIAGVRNTLIAMASEKREPNVVVLGGGSWGTTVASICARRGPTLQWVRSEATASDINEGLEQGTNMRMSQIIEETLPGHPAGILAGPNIAREVGEGYAAAAVLAMPDQHLATRLSGLFRTRRFRVYTTDDVIGVEMAGALKNVYAISVGMGYSLGIGENTRALVIARALREMTKLGVALGGNPDTFPGLAGLGDLIVTCTSQRSRNRHVGEQLGAGKPIDEIIASMNQVAEGVKAASVIMEFANEFGLTMPIAREVDAVINHGSSVEEAYRGLIAEVPGHEVHGSGF
jgi:glycerol-3-phosphate dehydrogenase (NAD(P)+)